MGRMKEYFYDQLVEEQNNDQEYIEWQQRVAFAYKFNMKEMSKQEFGEFLDHLNHKIAQGNGTGAEVQTLRKAIKLYIKRFGV